MKVWSFLWFLLFSIISCTSAPHHKESRIQSLIEVQALQRNPRSEGQEDLLPDSQIGYILLDPQTYQYRFKTYLVYQGRIQGHTLIACIHPKARNWSLQLWQRTFKQGRELSVTLIAAALLSA